MRKLKKDRIYYTDALNSDGKKIKVYFCPEDDSYEGKGEYVGKYFAFGTAVKFDSKSGKPAGRENVELSTTDFVWLPVQGNNPEHEMPDGSKLEKYLQAFI